MSLNKPNTCEKKKSSIKIQNKDCNCTEKKNNFEDIIIHIETIYPKNLEDIGRDQFFHHYKKSQFPIRDITNKTEPHIEISAENHLRKCFQNSIKGFCKSKEKYLFLCTTVKNKEVGNGKFFGKRFIVGYIKKTKYEIREYNSSKKKYTVFGEICLVPFNQRLNYDDLKLNRSRSPQKFDKETTTNILNIIHSHNNNNVKDDCLEEMIKEEKAARGEGISIPNDLECLKEKCNHFKECLRRKVTKKNLFSEKNNTLM